MCSPPPAKDIVLCMYLLYIVIYAVILFHSCLTEQTATRQNVPLPNDHVEVGLEGGVFGNLFASYADGIFLNTYAL